MDIEQENPTFTEQIELNTTTAKKSKKNNTGTAKSRKKNVKDDHGSQAVPDGSDQSEQQQGITKSNRKTRKSTRKLDESNIEATSSASQESRQEELKPEAPKRSTRSKSQKTTPNKIQQKASDEMQVEVSEDPSTQFFKKMLLTGGLKDDLRKFLTEGALLYSIRPYTPEQLAELVTKYKEEQDPNNKEETLIELLVHRIDNSHLQIAELVDSCQQYLSTLDDCFSTITKEHLMKQILAAANQTNYSVKHEINSEELQKAGEFKIWEIKDENILVDLADLCEVSRARKIRVCQKRMMEHLVKLIKLIEKMKTADDTNKVIEEKQKYEKFQKAKEDIMNEVNQPKSAKKIKKPSVAKEGLSQSLKKMKIDSNKTTPSTTPIKDPITSSKDQLQQIVESVDDSSDPKIKSTPDSKSKLDTATKPKNNTLLTQFFIKKPQDEAKKTPIQKDQVKEKSMFRCLGSKKASKLLPLEKQHEFLDVLSGQNKAQPSIETLKENLLALAAGIPKSKNRDGMEIEQKICTTKFRKVFVNIQDSYRKIKGRFDSKSGFISGRNPFTKDPQVDYEMDSEDEYENQFADNLDGDDADDKDEDDEEEEDKDSFIVSDEHLSNDEIDLFNEGDIDDNSRKVYQAKKNTTIPGTIQTRKPFFFSLIDAYKPGNDCSLDEYLESFKIVKLMSEDFPMKPKESKKIGLNDKNSSKLNPNAIDERDNLIVLVRALHGTYTNKDEVVKEVNAKLPHCSKNSIERKIKEICSRDKVEGENKKRLLVRKEIFEELKIEDAEYNHLLNTRRIDQEEKDAEAKRMRNEEKEKEKQRVAALGQNPITFTSVNHTVVVVEGLPVNNSAKEGIIIEEQSALTIPSKKTPLKLNNPTQYEEVAISSSNNTSASLIKSQLDSSTTKKGSLAQTTLVSKMSKSRSGDSNKADSINIGETQCKDNESNDRLTEMSGNKEQSTS